MHFFHVYIASSKHFGGLGEFLKVMQTPDYMYVLVGITVLNSPNPPGVKMRLSEHGKSALLLKGLTCICKSLNLSRDLLKYV